MIDAKRIKLLEYVATAAQLVGAQYTTIEVADLTDLVQIATSHVKLAEQSDQQRTDG